MIRIIGMFVCIILAVGIAILSMQADNTTYLLYLVVASLLGVLAGLFKSAGKHS